ncbi:hypothetical protein MOF18_19890, partial [Bacillus licheniformis]|nr:hypothetical protein [Bacillus licheniformis]
MKRKFSLFFFETSLIFHPSIFRNALFPFRQASLKVQQFCLKPAFLRRALSLKKSIRKAGSFKEYMELLKTKRYTWT